jgi:hypothetical protein
MQRIYLILIDYPKLHTFFSGLSLNAFRGALAFDLHGHPGQFVWRVEQLPPVATKTPASTCDLNAKRETNMKTICAIAVFLASFGPLPLYADDGSSDKPRCRPSMPVRESIEISDHVIFGTDQAVFGATTLIRDLRNCVINVDVTTTALEANWAYSIWVAVFNHPEYCATPDACVVSDLEAFGGDPRIRASVFWGGGLVADGTGAGNTSFVILPGRTDRELFANTRDYGLQNFGGAEIHIVLRSHGLAGMWGPVSDQIGTAGLACPPSPPEGPGCVNEFASFHPPRQ